MILPDAGEILTSAAFLYTKVFVSEMFDIFVFSIHLSLFITMSVTAQFWI